MPRPTDEYLATLTPNTREYILSLEQEVERLQGIVEMVKGALTPKHLICLAAETRLVVMLALWPESARDAVEAAKEDSNA